MNKKVKVKVAIDILMTGLLLFLMGYQFWGDVAHEWAGAAMFVLFIIHHILNRNWYKGLVRGRYSIMRIVQLIVNAVLFITMIGMMVSGIILSRHVFAFLPIQGGTSFARIVHMACAYWGFVLMALHLGLHWNMILGMVRKVRKREVTSKTGNIIAFLIATAIAVYGLTVFIRRGLTAYMFLRTQFVFLDYQEPKIIFYLEYLAMMGLFVYIIHYVLKLVRNIRKKRLYTIIAIIAASVFMTACSGSETQQENSVGSTGNGVEDETEGQEVNTENSLTEQNVLIAYFTRLDNTDSDLDLVIQGGGPYGEIGDSFENADMDAVASASITVRNDEVYGNTQVIAEMIQETVGGDLFSIQTEELYPTNYDELIDAGQQENEENARPALATHVENMDEYDIVFLGYPKMEYHFSCVLCA